MVSKRTKKFSLLVWMVIPISTSVVVRAQLSDSITSIDRLLLKRNKVVSEQDEEPFDDRTLLDTFGEVAKEFLTTRVIPPTAEQCRWDWRHARCEPFCECHTLWKVGDYHLGRSCRNRTEALVEILREPPEQCEEPPQNVYSKFLSKGLGPALERAQHLKTKAQDKAQLAVLVMIQRVNELQDKTCESIPETCSAIDSPRNWKQKLLCNHIPDACDDFDFSNGSSFRDIQPDPEDYENVKVNRGGRWKWV